MMTVGKMMLAAAATACLVLAGCQETTTTTTSVNGSAQSDVISQPLVRVQPVNPNNPKLKHRKPPPTAAPLAKGNPTPDGEPIPTGVINGNTTGNMTGSPTGE